MQVLGAREEGAKGFAGGVVKGVAGLVLLPLGGSIAGVVQVLDSKLPLVLLPLGPRAVCHSTMSNRCTCKKVRRITTTFGPADSTRCNPDAYRGGLECQGQAGTPTHAHHAFSTRGSRLDRRSLSSSSTRD